MITLGQVANINVVEQVAMIARENTQGRVGILVNVRGRDTAGFVEEATRKIREQVQFPDGYYFEFGGQFKNLIEAKARLMIVVPMALVPRWFSSHEAPGARATRSARSTKSGSNGR